MAYAKTGREGKTRWELLQDNLRDLGTFLYSKDPESGETLVMGRNGKSWAKISVFFLIFYGCLAAFFAAMLSIFMTTVPAREEGPKMTKYLAGRQALLMVPAKIEKGSYDPYVKAINQLLSGYEAMTASNYQNCTSEEREKGSKPCLFDLTTLGECYSTSSNFKYGYDEDKPCIFIRMNKVYGWSPEFVEGKDYVKVHCFFEKTKSRENLHLMPAAAPGFPKKFFPFFSEESWKHPLVALKVNTTSPGVVHCTATAKNIEQSETFRLSRGARGKGRIEIKLD